MTIKSSFPDSAPLEVAFALSAPGARAVSVAIFFNQWSVAPPAAERTDRDESTGKDHLMVRSMVGLKQVETGQWRCTMPLSPGWYEYLFVVDGSWVMDPDAPEVCPDGAGGFNAARMVEAVAATATSPAVSRLAASTERGTRRPALRRAM